MVVAMHQTSPKRGRPPEQTDAAEAGQPPPKKARSGKFFNRGVSEADSPEKKMSASDTDQMADSSLLAKKVSPPTSITIHELTRLNFDELESRKELFQKHVSVDSKSSTIVPSSQGAFATRDFNKDEVIGFYHGDLVFKSKLRPVKGSSAEASEKKAVNYILWQPFAGLLEADLDTHIAWTNHFTDIDAEIGIYGSEQCNLRFTNHQNEHNTHFLAIANPEKVYSVKEKSCLRQQGLTKRDIYIVVCAARDIQKGEELSFCYTGSIIAQDADWDSVQSDLASPGSVDPERLPESLGGSIHRTGLQPESDEDNQSPEPMEIDTPDVDVTSSFKKIFAAVADTPEGQKQRLQLLHKAREPWVEGDDQQRKALFDFLFACWISATDQPDKADYIQRRLISTEALGPYKPTKISKKGKVYWGTATIFEMLHDSGRLDAAALADMMPVSWLKKHPEMARTYIQSAFSRGCPLMNTMENLNKEGIEKVHESRTPGDRWDLKDVYKLLTDNKELTEEELTALSHKYGAASGIQKQIYGCKLLPFVWAGNAEASQAYFLVNLQNGQGETDPEIQASKKSLRLQGGGNGKRGRHSWAQDCNRMLGRLERMGLKITVGKHQFVPCFTALFALCEQFPGSERSRQLRKVLFDIEHEQVVRLKSTNQNTAAAASKWWLGIITPKSEDNRAMNLFFKDKPQQIIRLLVVAFTIRHQQLHPEKTIPFETLANALTTSSIKPEIFSDKLEADGDAPIVWNRGTLRKLLRNTEDMLMPSEWGELTYTETGIDNKRKARLKPQK